MLWVYKRMPQHLARPFFFYRHILFPDAYIKLLPLDFSVLSWFTKWSTLALLPSSMTRYQLPFPESIQPLQNQVEFSSKILSMFILLFVSFVVGAPVIASSTACFFLVVSPELYSF